MNAVWARERAGAMFSERPASGGSLATVTHREAALAGPTPKPGAAGRVSSPSGFVWAVAVVAGSAALVGAASPFQLTAPGMRGAVEMLIASSALVGVMLLLANFRQRHERADLLLLIALAAVGSTDFVFLALPAMADARLSGFGSALQLACDAWAAVAFAAAAFARTGSLAGFELRRLRLAGIVAGATIALAALVASLAGGPVPGSAAPQTGIGAAAAHPVPLAAALFAGAVFLVAGLAFFGRPEPSSHALAGASFLLAAAKLQYLALPVLQPDVVAGREALRLAAYALLVAAALGRYAQARRALAAAALAVERERIARDLHDGLAQDLALIAVESEQLYPQLGDEHPLTIAARRAVAASRGVIVDLSASTAASTELALRQVADELTVRFGIDVDVEMVDDPDRPAESDLDAARREEIVRIAREAIVNAARHGGARHVTLALDRAGDHARLRVSDDGRGFTEAEPRGQVGHGLQMMRARASALGGLLALRRRTQGGTELEITFPYEQAAVG